MKGSAQGDLVIVIALIVLLGVAWYYTGGPQRTIDPVPFFTLPQYGTGTPAYTVPRVEFTPTEKSPDDVPRTTITTTLGTFTEERSPYAEHISLEIANAKSGIGTEYLTIRTASNMPERITVTGWRIESTATSLGATLLQAAELPFQGTLNPQGPVVLGPGQTAYIVTGRSPNGTSFRTNLCTGYFEQFQNFEPRLRLDCPSPETEADAFLTTGEYNDECHSIVRSLSRCTFNTQSVPLSAGTRCEQLIHSELSYNGCMNRHKNDPKFYKNEWYLYLNRDQELWASRSERIRLVDQNGKVVDSVSY